MTSFATEEAKIAIHLSLSLLLGQLAVFSEFRREVGLVAVGRAGGWSTGVVGRQTGVVVVVGAGVVFSVVWLAVGLRRFVGFVGFTGTGVVLTADFGVTFPVVGINRLDEGVESVEVVRWRACS